MKLLMRNYHYLSTLDELLRDESSEENQIVRFLEMVIRDRMWKERFVLELMRKVTFEKFEEFVKASYPEGLGTTVEQLKMRCAFDKHAVDLMDRELNRKDSRKNRLEDKSR